MSAEVEVKKISMKTFIVGIILVATVGLLSGISYNVVNLPWWFGSTYGRAPTGSPYMYLWHRTFVAMNIAVFTLFIVTLINMAKPIFKKQEIAVIFIMILLAGFMSSATGYEYCEHLSFFFTYGMGCYSPTRKPPEEDLAKIQTYLADIMGLGKDADYWEMVMSTWWSPMRWDYVMPMIVWGGFLLSMLCLVGVFIALTLRRLYVDVEALTFPFAALSNEMINTSQPADGKLRFFNKYFLIGFLIQFLWIIIGTVPWDIWQYIAYGEQTPWGTGVGRFGDIHIFPVYDATQLAILPWVCLNIFLDPWLIGWGVLLPMDVIVGVLIGWFVFLVMVPIAWTAMGNWEPMSSGTFGYSPYYRTFWTVPTGGTPNLTWIIFGMIIALAVLPIVRNLSTMGPIFAAITGKEPPEDVDPDRPLPYKIVMWGFIGSMILYVAAASVANAMPQYTLLWVLLTAFLLFGGFRLVAETGGYMGWSNIHPFPTATGPQWVTTIILAVMGSGIAGIEPTRATLMTYAFISYGLGTTFYYTAHGAGYMTLESFKLAKLSGVRLKDLWWVAIVTLVLTMFMSGVSAYLWNFVFPQDKFYGAVYPWLGAGLFFNIYQKNIATGIPYWMDRGPVLNLTQNPGPTDAAIKIIVGAALIVSLTLLRERYPVLRISAAGLALGALAGAKFWAAFIVALLIKYVTLRVGGVRLYEEKVKPVMVGFLYGFFLAFVIHWIIYVPGWIRGQYGLV